MSKHDYWQESNQDILSSEVVENRAWEAADKLIMKLEDSDSLSGEDADELREYFASQCASLLAQEYSINAPESTRK